MARDIAENHAGVLDLTVRVEKLGAYDAYAW